MSQSLRRLLLVALAIYVSSTQGLLVVGPQRIRSNQEYNMVISNFNTQSVNLRVRMEGYRDDGGENLIITKVVHVRGNANLMVTFKVPSLSPGFYKIIVDGQRGFNFHKEVELEFISKSISGFIQLDKPVYKPGDSVHFRVIVLDSNLKPPANVKSVNVVIKDSRGNVIRKWSAGRLHVGVFEGNLEIAPTPLLGIWNILVKVDDEELVSKPFEVKEYMLTSFEVNVFPTTVPLEEHQGLNLTISAKNAFGKPVSGKVELTVFSSHSLMKVQATRQVDGVAQLEMRFNRQLYIYEQSEDVNLNFTFTEQYTNRSISKSLPITVYKSMYGAKLIKETPDFQPGKVFRATLKLEHRDGSPAKSVEGRVEVDGLEEPYEKKFQTDGNGETTLELMPSETDALLITVSVGEHTILEEEISKAHQITEAFVKIYLKSDIQPSRPIELEVICREKVRFLVYYVLSKCNVIDQGFIRKVKSTFSLNIKYSDNMVPKAKVFVATVTKNIVVYDIIDIIFPDLPNNFEMKMEDHEVQPGEQIQLEMSGRPGSYVALAAYDKSLLQFGSTHDMYWNDVWQLYDTFHGTDETQFDAFMHNGLFAAISDNVSFEQAQRIGRNRNVPKPFQIRTNFAESFLWMNATMDISGQLTVIDYTPDTTTAWYLTGFAMHPTYGLGIIKKPLQLHTVKAFYLADHLPYSIKRGEVVTLQFTVFNNLGADYITEVMVINVQDQMEFVEEPSSKLNFSKVLTVKQTVGIPVSFLVKAKKLGEMVVRVKASNMLETDAIEKVIRVLPESIVERKMESRIFSHDSHLNSSFEFNLNIDEKADPGSQKITFTINPNLLTTVATDLGDLLRVPTGCGEQNMMRFVPNVIVLDYLVATGSKDAKLMEKATRLLRQGYQSQLRYLKEDGSFGVWLKHEGGVFLTAFVAKSMQTASKHIREIDEAIVERAFDWLASKQHSSGRFDAYGPMYHYDMQGGLRNGIALTSYVLIAFMENEKAKEAHEGVVAKGIEYVANLLPSVTDLYDLSIATYAMMLNNHPAKHTYLQTLVERSIKNETMMYWDRQPHEVETTAYALMAMILNESYEECLPVMRWLANQRYVTGSFPRTQDTFVGLKALTKIVEKISPSRNSYKIELKYKTTVKTFIMSDLNVEAKQFGEIPEDVRELKVNVAGVGFGLLDVKYEYSLDLRNYSHRFDLQLQKLSSESDDKLQLKICASFIPDSKNTRSNMALIEAYFPSGYVVDNNPISEATTFNPIRNVEIRFGATSVVAYYDNMGTERNCFHITAYRRFKVSLKRPAYVLVHDYYDPKLNSIQVYELDPRKE